jgi:hypothetical protein
MEVKIMVYGIQGMTIMKGLHPKNDEQFPLLLADLVRSIPAGVNIVFTDECHASDKVTVQREHLEEILEAGMQPTRKLGQPAGRTHI